MTNRPNHASQSNGITIAKDRHRQTDKPLHSSSWSDYPMCLVHQSLVPARAGICGRARSDSSPTNECSDLQWLQFDLVHLKGHCDESTHLSVLSTAQSRLRSLQSAESSSALSIPQPSLQGCGSRYPHQAHSGNKKLLRGTTRLGNLHGTQHAS